MDKLIFPQRTLPQRIISLWKDGKDTYEIAKILTSTEATRVSEALAYSTVTDYLLMKYRRPNGEL